MAIKQRFTTVDGTRAWMVVLALLLMSVVGLTTRTLSHDADSKTTIGYRVDLHTIDSRTEAWASRPFVLVETLDGSQSRQFIEEQRSLVADLMIIAEHSEELALAADETRAAIGEADQLSREYTLGFHEDEKAAVDYGAAAADVRSKMENVLGMAEAHDAQIHAELRHSQTRNMQALTASIMLTGGWILFGTIRGRRLRGQDYACVIAVAEGNPYPVNTTAEIAPMPRDRMGVAVDRLAASYHELRASSEFSMQRQENLRNFTEALETTDDEEELLMLLQRMLRQRHPDKYVQILLTDASEASLDPVYEDDQATCSCAPHTPSRCKALRMGRVLTVDDADSVAACPRVTAMEHRDYACFPLTVAGRTAAALRLTGRSEAADLSMNEVLDVMTVAQRFAVRLGVLRLLMETSRQARTDALTGLVNRRVMVDKLETMIREAGSPGHPPLLGVLGLDLDKFKNLNDTYGHAAGDTALRSFVNAVKAVLPEGCVFGRMGGEEFSVFAAVHSVDEALAIGEAICEAARETVARGASPATTCSVGLAMLPIETHSGAGALRLADERLYIAKERGRDQVVGPQPHTPAVSPVTTLEPQAEA